MYKFIKVIPVLAYLISFNAGAEGAARPRKLTQPRLEKASGSPIEKIELGADAEAALKQYNPDFTPYAGEDFIPEVYAESEPFTPMAVLGDFNGDGIKDIALLGHDKKNEIAVALVSSGASYQAIEIVPKRPYVDPKTITYPPPEVETDAVRQRGLYKYLSPGVAVKKIDTVQIEYLFGSTVSYALSPKTGKFGEYRGGAIR